MHAHRRAASLDRARTAGPPASPRPRLYDPYSLAVRPLPADLKVFPHPKGLTDFDIRRITNGAVR